MPDFGSRILANLAAFLQSPCLAEPKKVKVVILRGGHVPPIDLPFSSCEHPNISYAQADNVQDATLETRLDLQHSENNKFTHSGIDQSNWAGGVSDSQAC